jgi:hypothetical protein
VSFAAITLSVASQRVFVVVVVVVVVVVAAAAAYFAINYVRKLLNTSSYIKFTIRNCFSDAEAGASFHFMFPNFR